MLPLILLVPLCAPVRVCVCVCVFLCTCARVCIEWDVSDVSACFWCCYCCPGRSMQALKSQMVELGDLGLVAEVGTTRL